MKNGDTVVVDGSTGHVIVNPDAEAESAYRKLQREFVHLKDVLAENRDLPAVTADGRRIELLANVNNVDDARKAARRWAPPASGCSARRRRPSRGPCGRRPRY